MMNHTLARNLLEDGTWRTNIVGPIFPDKAPFPSYLSPSIKNLDLTAGKT